LTQIIAELPREETVTLNHLIDRTGARGPYGMLVVLSLPFITPISLPGISNVLGVVMIGITWRLMRGHPPHLPKFAGNKTVQATRLAKLLRVAVKALRFIEKLVKPRRSVWLTAPVIRGVNALLVISMALMLALPIPPTIPLSNMLPSYAIILLSFSMMEEDGWLIWLAYFVTAGTLIYLAAMMVIEGGAIVALYTKYFHRIIEWFQ
jgi:hypothetical protein